MVKNVEEILENVESLVEFLDQKGLEEVDDLLFLEMAKYVSITRKVREEAPNERE